MSSGIPDPFVKGFTSYLGILENMADFVEATAQIEEVTGLKTTDLSKLWGNEQAIKGMTERLGLDKMARLAILLVRLSAFNPAATLNLPWQEKLKSAEELRNIVIELKSIFAELGI